MKYTKLLKAANTKEKAPSLMPESLTPEQDRLAGEGQCIQCGNRPATKTSYLCETCEGSQTLEAIQKNIQSLRNRILNDQSGGE